MIKKKLSVTFVLPCIGLVPIGGFKVVYEYANGLVRRGHKVTIVHPAVSPSETLTLFQNGKRAIRYFQRAINKSYRPDRWFSLDPRVHVRWVMNLREHNIPQGDCIVATAWETAEHVARYSSVKGVKYYFVQDYERFASADPLIKSRMGSTYRLGMRMTYISPVVREMILSCGGEPDLYLPNGVRNNVYSLTKPVDSPERDMIGFPVRRNVIKGTDEAIKALEIVRGLYPDLKVWSFGRKEDHTTPSWIDHHELPSDGQIAELYNRTKIFVVPSHYEGWGLPGSEAMACGAALVTTDNGGCRAYAKDGSTAVIVQPRSPSELADGVVRLLRNEQLRLQLAQSGHEHILQFTWDRAVDAMEELLLSPQENSSVSDCLLKV